MNCNAKSVFRILACPLLLWTVPGAILLSPAGFGVTRCAAAEGDEEGAEVLTRGPVHEAFAETVVFKPTPGILASKAPPSVIEELPPDQRPEGDNVTWIPGYWAWDDEGNEFLWVSGIWRNLPPGRQWVPGSWQEAGQEFQWVSGYWADAAAEEVEYLPEPPASRDVGPNVDSPSDDSIWISGSWMWRQNRYLWRPGYYDTARPDWVWMPAHYVWTRHGYIFVDGYWDYSIARRGMIFAPMRFSAAYYSRPDYYYRPSVVISLAIFGEHLFLRPRSRHYYFGDYYDSGYRRSGYISSHNYYSGGFGYDPIFAHQRWSHRGDRRWERNYDENFRYLREHREERPPRTLAAFEQFVARPDRSSRVDATMATPLAKFVTTSESNLKLKPVNKEEQEKFAVRGREVRDFGNKWKDLSRKSPDAADKPKSDKSEPTKVRIPKSPMVSQLPEKRSEADTPPERPKATLPGDKPSKVHPGDKPEVTPDKLPPTRPGRGSKEKPEPDKGDKPDTDPGKPGEGRPGRKPKVEPIEPPKVEPKVDPKDLPKREPKVEPKDIPKREPKMVPKVEPKREPKVEPQPPRREPKVEPIAPPKREPKIEPKPEPKREPKFEPRREPKVEPRPQPKVEPKREPRVEPKREPKVEPRKEPKKEEPEEKDKRRKG